MSEWTKLNVRLRLEGIGGRADVWINGRPGEMESQTASSATFDITKQLAPNVANLIAVRITPSQPSAGELKGPIPGSISDEVNLIAADEAHIDSIEAEPGPTGWVTLHVKLVNTSDKSGDAQLQAEVFDAAMPKKRVSGSTINVVISPGRNRADMAIKLKRPKMPEGSPPTLYRGTVTFRQVKDILDNDTISFLLPASGK